MNRLALAVLLSATFCGASALANNILTYDPQGTGGWRAATQYKERVAPQAGDRVNINAGTSCTALVSKADFAFVNSLHEIVLYNQSTLKFEIPDDADAPYWLDNVQLHGQASAHSGGGLIIKTGAGRLFYGAANHKATSSLTTPCMGFLIEDGVMTFQGNVDSQIDVRSPGKLTMRSDVTDDFTCYGLNGDGVVECEAARQFCFAGGTEARPNVFTGTFVGKVMPTLKNGYQYLTNPSAFSANVDIRLWRYVVGVTKFGWGNEAGSLGLSKTLWVRGDPTRILYLGAGEKTDRGLTFNTDSGEATLDAGATGGLTWTGDISTKSTRGRMCQLALDGSNTVECVLQAPIIDSSTNATYVTKRGTGVWKMNNSNMSNGGHGGIAVENGILRYVSIAEAGHNCSLGYADLLYESYSGAPDESRRVGYAFKLGDGTDFEPGKSLPVNSATLAYCGPSAVLCNTRPVALSGAGRLRNETDFAFLHAGVTSLDDGDHALVLDADGADNLVRDVTNGTGRITVVKEGAGTWTVAGGKDFSGVEVRAGTLKLTSQENFTFFRFTAKDVVNKSSYYQLGEMRFWDAEDHVRSENLRYRNCVGDVSKLNPGEVTDLRTFVKSGDCSLNTRGIRGVENLFTNLVWSTRSAKDVIWSGGTGKNADPEVAETWQGFICRLSEGTPVTRYDMMYAGGLNSREVTKWTLEGSLDGLNWTLLHSASYDASPVTAVHRWYSTNKDEENRLPGEGFAIVATNADRYVSGPISMGVNAGATLVSDAEVAVNEIVYDAAKGGGSLDGFAFAESGTFRIVNAASDKVQALDLPMTFGTNVSGQENVAGWSVVLNGTAMGSRRTVTATPDGFKMTSSGLMLIIR